MVLGGEAVEEFYIKSNELNNEEREQIKSVLKSEDWVDAFLLLFEWLLKIEPSVVIYGHVGNEVGFNYGDEYHYLFYIVNSKRAGLQCRSSLPMKSLDFTFWDALKAVQKSRYQDNEQRDDWMWYSDHYIPQEKQNKEAEKRTNREKAAGSLSVDNTHSETEASFDDLINKQVIHKTFGHGIIASLHGQTVKVFFDGGIGEKAFVFPDAFGNFLKFEDPTLQQYVNELINNQCQ